MASVYIDTHLLGEYRAAGRGRWLAPSHYAPHGALAVLAIPLVLLLAAPADPPKELPAAAKEELKALEGKWKVVKVLHPDITTTPAADGYEVIVTFKGSAIDFNGAGAGEVI